jgi:hypothetical protein
MKTYYLLVSLPNSLDKYKEPKTYIRMTKDPSPDERLRKEPLLEASLDRSQFRNTGTQTSIESAIYKILK